MATICNTVASYLTNLGATHAICTALGDTLTFGHNLFISIGPATDSNSLTIEPYGGPPPELDKYRQTAAIQIMSRTNSRNDGLNVQQALINDLHMNELSGKGKMFAKHSIPLPLGTFEGGEKFLAVSNYTIRFVKV
jgi:hypothetical protein